MLGRASIQTVPKAGDYLTDGARLVQVICYHGENVVGEDVSSPADVPAPIVSISPQKLREWAPVQPLADAA